MRRTGALTVWCLVYITTDSPSRIDCLDSVSLSPSAPRIHVDSHRGAFVSKAGRAHEECSRLTGDAKIAY
jgi:hypothetical protein